MIELPRSLLRGFKLDDKASKDTIRIIYKKIIELKYEIKSGLIV